MPGGNPLGGVPLGPTGPASPPSPNLGAQADALSKVQQAVKLLSLQLPAFPVGSEEQKAVMDAITKLSKIAPADMAPTGVQMSSIKSLEEEATKTAMLRQLLSAPGGPGAGAGAPPPSGPPGTLPGMI